MLLRGATGCGHPRDILINMNMIPPGPGGPEGKQRQQEENETEIVWGTKGHEQDDLVWDNGEGEGEGGDDYNPQEDDELRGQVPVPP